MLALPAIWRRGQPSQIVQTLLDVLLRTLRLDFAYARLNYNSEHSELRSSGREDSKINLPSREFCNVLGDSFAACAQGSLTQMQNQLGVEDISIFPVSLGVEGSIGVIVLGSSSAGFPGKTESLLLSVAANQASIGLQEAKLLSEQKRISAELEQRVAERTMALAQTNEELRKEIVERKAAEERLRKEEQELKRSEERWRSVFENSAVGVALADLNGRLIATDPVFQAMVGTRSTNSRESPLWILRRRRIGP